MIQLKENVIMPTMQFGSFNIKLQNLLGGNNMATDIWSWAETWWSAIVIISAVNLLIGLYIFNKSRVSKKGNLASYHRRMRIAGLIFVGVAFYRSIFVSNYLLQLAWFDTILNSTLLIRFFATFAELAFAYLIMSAMLQLNRQIPHTKEIKNKFQNFLVNKSPVLFFIFLATAQIFAYGGAITKVHLLFAIEETLWGLAFLAITPLSIIQFIRINNCTDYSKKELGQFKIFALIIMVWCIGYGGYSLFYHLPIEYWPAAINQLQVGNPDPAFRWGFDAVKDTLFVVNDTRDYSTWGGMGFVIWHSGYFTLCGWMSLFFMKGPTIQKEENQ